MRVLKEFLAPGVIPFALAILFAIASMTYGLLGLPSPAELASMGRDLYLKYGLLVLFAAALLEGLFMVNIYLPGSFVIVLSVYLSDRSVSELAAIAAVTWTAFLLASVVNYLLGSTGGYRSLLALGRKDTIVRMQKWIGKRGRVSHLLTAIHPNIQAVFSVCLGISRFGLARATLRSAIALLLWVPLWTVFFSIALKTVDIQDSRAPLYVIALLVLIGLAMSIFERLRQQRRRE